MKRLTTFLTSLLIVAAVTCSTSWANEAPPAPKITIKGKVIAADDKLPIIGAYIKLNAADSTNLTKQGYVVVTDPEGNFVISSTEKNSTVTVSFIGYKDFNKEIVRQTGKAEFDLGTITLSTQAINIGSVVVVGRAAISKVSGDTIQYNAAAFKTNPDATTEDLLKKMPGVTTDDNGALQSQGEKITKVLVNGKEYFDDDPSLALKSLPAEAVESIQVFDDQSEQAKFSGFDDGERVKTINIVTKKGVIGSTFGKVFGGYGTDNRYVGGVGINSFNEKHRVTIVAQADNVNGRGFTLSDIANSQGGRGGGRGGMSGGGGSDLGAFTTPTRGGIMTGQMAAINYNGELGKRFKLSGNYTFQGRKADSWQAINQDYLMMSRQYIDTTESLGYEYSHNAVIRTEWNPNEYNRIRFNPRVSFSTNRGSSYNNAITYLNGNLGNATRNQYSTDMMSYNVSTDLWWQHRFKKAGRTMSIGGIINGRKAIGNREQYSIYGSNDPILGWVPDTINQQGHITTSGSTITGMATYTEPLSKSSRLSVNYSIRYDRSISDKVGLNYDKAMQDYSLLDTVTTNYFYRNYTTQNAGLGYNFVKGKTLTINANLNYQYATLGNDESFPRQVMSKYSFNAILPGVRISFTPKQGQNLNLDYTTNSIFPSVNQLQDVLDVNNPLQVSKGNPNLGQGYSNNLRLRYNYANTEKNSNFSLMLSANQTSNYIANHRIFLEQDTIVNGTAIPAGARYTTPVNLSGYFNAMMFATYSFAIKPIKSNMSASVFYRFSNTPSIENYIDYISVNNSIGMNLSLTSNISENVDFTLAYRPSLRLSKGGVGNFDRYFSHDVSAFVNIIFWKGFFINADASWRNSFGTQESYGQHYGIVNAAIGKKFFKYKQGDLRIQGYDLLNQNRSFWQSTNDTYVQTTTSTILQRYFMVSFTYKFDTRKSRSAANYGQGESQSGGRWMPRNSGGGGSMRPVH